MKTKQIYMIRYCYKNNLEDPKQETVWSEPELYDDGFDALKAMAEAGERFPNRQYSLQPVSLHEKSN